MTFDAWFAVILWGVFLLAYLPWQVIKHRRVMRSLAAINKGHRFMEKYALLKRITANRNKANTDGVSV